MEFLGIGPLEFLLIVVIAVIVLGPKGMVKAAREAGQLIRKVVHSPLWREVVDTSREIREFPREIARGSGIEEEMDELWRSTQGTFDEIKRSHHPDIKPDRSESPAKESQPEEKKADLGTDSHG